MIMQRSISPLYFLCSLTAVHFIIGFSNASIIEENRVARRKKDDAPVIWNLKSFSVEWNSTLPGTSLVTLRVASAGRVRSTGTA